MRHVSEFRIYFECLEQANYYVLPILKTVLNKIYKKEITIKLVKLTRNAQMYSKNVAPFIFWKVPDILITAVTDDEEIPIIAIEFSTAVFTEDHELQRFDGLVAAAENEILFIKISPLAKVSEYKHGGNIDFDFRVPYSLIYKKYGIIFYHIDWKSNGTVVEVSNDCLSCPKERQYLMIIMEAAINAFLAYKEEWIYNVEMFASKNPVLQQWINIIKNYKLPADMLMRDTTRIQKVSPDDILEDYHIELKFNRFGHSMDPERGMLPFYSILVNGEIVSKMIFSPENDAWYKDTPNERAIKQYIMKNGLKKPSDYFHCFALGTGLSRNSEFIKLIKKLNKSCLDITDFARKNYMNLNKSLRTILKFSKGFIIEDKNGRKRVILKWSPIAVDNILPVSSHNITPLESLTTFDEDLVTYVCVHNIFRKQGFEVIAASYPGAQGDRVILIEAGTGRRQKRRYVDIIAIKLEVNISVLQGNKGKFSSEKINKDIVELKKFRTERGYKEGLKMFFKRFKPEVSAPVVKIGVGFWAYKDISVEDVGNGLLLDELDYFIYITKDLSKWKIWKTGEDNIFIKMEGNIEIPLLYQIKKQ